MATPVQQGGTFSGRTQGGDASCSFLYAEIRNSSMGKQGTSDCRAPRAPLTPRALNQTQQRNVVRQWVGLPPIETGLQRTRRQAGLAAGHVLRIAENALLQMASRAVAGWRGMQAFSGASLIQALPDLHIGPPGAAAQRTDVPRPAGSASNETPCDHALFDALDWESAFPKLSTVDAMLAACPGVGCSDDAVGDLQDITVVIESGEEVRKLAMGLAARGATVFLSPGAISALGNDSLCLDPWFGSGHARLDNVTPGDWTPASGGSVVLLSSQEFADKLAALRKSAYPFCHADALACQPAIDADPAPKPPESRSLFADADTAAEIGITGLTFMVVGSIVFSAGKALRFFCMRAAQPLTNAAVVPPPAGNAAAPAATPPATTVAPAALPAGPATGGTVVPLTPAPSQIHTLTYDHTHPPAGHPGGD
jgi:hypothetical protein